jgi:hypothetical protein
VLLIKILLYSILLFLLDISESLKLTVKVESWCENAAALKAVIISKQMNSRRCCAFFTGAN